MGELFEVIERLAKKVWCREVDMATAEFGVWTINVFRVEPNAIVIELEEGG